MGLMASKGQMILSTGKKRKSRPYRLSATNSGFTLLELMLVAVIILCLVALSTPLFKRTYEELKLTSSAREINAILNFCREKTIFERRPHEFRIDADKGSYRIFTESENEKEKELKPLSGRWGRTFTIPKGISLETEAEEISFSPGGSATPAVIYLSNSEGKNRTIEIEGPTGYIKVYDYKKE